MLQGDMIGYNAHKGDHLGLAFVEGYTDSALTRKVRGWVQEYVPELRISNTKACCSDHQSFYEQGYPSVGFVEAGGYVIDPEYHQVGDVVRREGYDLEQIVAITKAIGASMCELAGLLQ
jgi:hypothetical protein